MEEKIGRLPLSWQAAVRCCLVKDANKRIQTSTELICLLEDSDLTAVNINPIAKASQIISQNLAIKQDTPEEPLQTLVATNADSTIKINILESQESVDSTALTGVNRRLYRHTPSSARGRCR